MKDFKIGLFPLKISEVDSISKIVQKKVDRIFCA